MSIKAYITVMVLLSVIISPVLADTKTPFGLFDWIFDGNTKTIDQVKEKPLPVIERMRLRSYDNKTGIVTFDITETQVSKHIVETRVVSTFIREEHGMKYISIRGVR